MILINLLPHREERRKRRKAAFFAGLGMSAIVGLCVVGGWWLVVQQLMANQQQRNQFLTAEIKKLEVQIKDIASLRAEIDSLKAGSAPWKTSRSIATFRSICSTNW